MITSNKYEVYIILIFGIAGINDTGKASISDFLVNSQTGILLVTQTSCCVYIGIYSQLFPFLKIKSPDLLIRGG